MTETKSDGASTFTDGRKMVRTLFGAGGGSTTRRYLRDELNRTMDLCEFDISKGRPGYTDYRRGYLSGLVDLIGKSHRSGIESPTEGRQCND
jgi:hypothetical protein